MTDTGDITLATILEHMRGMEQRLRKEFRTEMSSMKKAIDGRFDKLERKVDLITGQINTIDERLDDIEIVHIPALRQAVGIR